MAKYIQIEFQNISTEQSDILVAELIHIGFEGFEEGEDCLKEDEQFDITLANINKNVILDNFSSLVKKIINRWNNINKWLID